MGAGASSSQTAYAVGETADQNGGGEGSAEMAPAYDAVNDGAAHVNDDTAEDLNVAQETVRSPVYSPDARDCFFLSYNSYLLRSILSPSTFRLH